jgi:hypothetical protein
MQHSTSFKAGDIVKYKEQYYLLLSFECSTKDGVWDRFTALYLNTGKISMWSFSEIAFTKVA